jgi:hypothetical protein
MNRLIYLVPCLVVAACPAPRERGARDRTDDTLPRAAPIGDVYGTWTVTGFRIPGISAMTAEEAGTWTGRTIELSPQSAATGAESCATPAYETITAPADSLLSIDYRIGPAALGLRPGGTIEVTRVSCSGSDWPSPGGLLLHTGADRAFTVWDGVFFELERS